MFIWVLKNDQHRMESQQLWGIDIEAPYVYPFVGFQSSCVTQVPRVCSNQFCGYVYGYVFLVGGFKHYLCSIIYGIIIPYHPN